MSIAELGVFVFSEDPLPQAFRSLADAEAEMEAIDVESGEYKAVYTLDGRIVSAATADNRVVLKVTAERDEADLDWRLREWAKRAPELNDLLGPYCHCQPAVARRLGGALASASEVARATSARGGATTDRFRLA